MKNVETDDAACTQIQQQIDEQKNKLDETRRQSETQAGEYEGQIAEIQVEWDKAAREIPPATMEIFNRVADTYDGQALAVAGKQEEHVDAFSCDGCFMGLPAEIVNRLMTKDEIIRCSNCTRILVLKTSEE
jgi:predicted  nucleic acid-binding Zn-ribbon protein